MPDIQLDSSAEPINIASKDVVTVLRARLKHETLSDHFIVGDDHKFRGRTLHIDTSNSLLLSFVDRSDEFSKDSGHRKLVYRLLVILDLTEEEIFPDPLRLDLMNIRQQFNVDRTIIWSANVISSEILRILKDSDVESVRFTDTERRKDNILLFFLPFADKSHEYDVAVNTAADLLFRRLKKLFHLVLSEVAAPKYDQLYGHGMIATREMMAWEEHEVKRISEYLKASQKDQLAVDVGCGTGRHTFPLAETFQEVYALDFSPRMIEMARERKKKVDKQNITFDPVDIEYEEVPADRVFTEGGEGKVDLIVASFGMGSFVEDTSQLLRRFHSWLRPGGYAFISFYNANALLLNVKPNWRDTSLSTHLDPAGKTLRVDLDEKTTFHIFCQPFSQEVLSRLRAIFDIEKISTYPSTMALMPNSLLSNPTALRLFRRVDKLLAAELEMRTAVRDLKARLEWEDDNAFHTSRLHDLLGGDEPVDMGYYVSVLARKTEIDTEGFSRVSSLLRERGIKATFIEHSKAETVADVLAQIKADDGQGVKTVIFRYRPTKHLFAVVLRGSMRIDRKALARHLGKVCAGLLIF